MYSSLAGYGLVLLRTCGWFMFIYSTFFTLKHYPEKGGFYYPFFSFYTLWFVAGPTIIIISNNVIAPWVRAKVRLLTKLLLLYLFNIIYDICTIFTIQFLKCVIVAKIMQNCNSGLSKMWKNIVKK